jgi:hypothetical protein
MKRKASILCAVALLALATLAWSNAGASAAPGGGIADPTIPPIPTAPPAPADGDTAPLTTPTDGRKVMDLDLTVSSDAPDALSTVSVASCVVLQDWSNKSLYAGPGQWTVQLQVPNGHPVAYGVQDPRFAELAATADQPPQEEFTPSAEWILDVPLFDGAQDLQVQEVDIFDQSGHPVLAEGIGSDGTSCQAASLPNARGASVNA